jgi:splicing factor 3B subunit 1
LNSVFPSAGYVILEPPATYVPIRTPARKAQVEATPAGFVMQDGFGTSAGGDGELIPEIPGLLDIC